MFDTAILFLYNWRVEYWYYPLTALYFYWWKNVSINVRSIYPHDIEINFCIKILSIKLDYTILKVFISSRISCKFKFTLKLFIYSISCHRIQIQFSSLNYIFLEMNRLDKWNRLRVRLVCDNCSGVIPIRVEAWRVQQTRRDNETHETVVKKVDETMMMEVRMEDEDDGDVWWRIIALPTKKMFN